MVFEASYSTSGVVIVKPRFARSEMKLRTECNLCFPKKRLKVICPVEGYPWEYASFRHNGDTFASVSVHARWDLPVSILVSACARADFP